MEEALQDLIDKTIPEEQSRRLKLFAERLFARLSGELAERMGPQRMLRLAQGAMEFFAIRAEPISLRVMSAEDGEATTIVETMMPDCAFIVDTLLEYFHQLGAPVPILLHPMFNVTRDEQGRLVSFEQALSTERRESFVHVELEFASSAASAEALAAELRSRLAEVRLVAGDFEAMAQRALRICEETAAVRELVEVRDLLRWLVQGGFIFLGYRRYRAETIERGATLTLEPGSGLGILRDESRSRFGAPVQAAKLDPAVHKLLFEGPALIIGKTRSPSRVHRIAAMDDITIRRAADGALAFDRLVGLFTSQAYAEEAQHIPVLRDKLRGVLEAEHAVEGSHDFREIVAAFNSFPKEELFRASVPELRAQLREIIDLKSETEVRLSLYPDLNRQNVIALVVMPRERFSAEVRVRIQDALARGLGGSALYYHLALSEGYTARLHFCFAARPAGTAVAARLREEIARVIRSWEDRLVDELHARFPRRRAEALALRWARAFPPAYQAATEIQRAAADIERLEAMLAGGAPGVELEAAGDEQASRLRIYDLDKAPALSELMPMLQNFAVRVLSEEAHELKPQVDYQQRRASVQVFRIQGKNGQPVAKMPGAALMAEALAAVRQRNAEDDPLNALTLEASLTWREVALVRAYLAAAFQMRLAPARPAVRRPILMHPELARALVDLFIARFDPEREARPDRIEQLRAAYRERLSAVENIADDRIARSILAMVEATVRTNYFAPIPAPDPYIALKFDSAAIPNLPDTPPRYEIHVNSPRMEGCHLRAGKVARGGIRFSDRPDDYRTEILGLMKTQTVKNAIIVPVGAKGGFIVKPREGRAIAEQDVVESYQTLIGAMLDLTDNFVAGRAVHPERVRVLDDDGPYLVVAADKGTAAFSDLANAIATRRGFWLGDAFASGGEHGYDHKRLGITARGAWESVRRHLRDMGRAPERGAPVRMVGIGDMSGDVFGNGLLQSDNLKLIAAFDHRHVFIDPDPDPAVSFAERKRLFALPGSSWADYDPARLSPGGGVYKRGAKEIVLSTEARAALGCEAAEFDSESLIRAVLRADVDLLYNGGIGTFVRASDETDTQVGDHANDACRISAGELRAKVVVEGGNLGFTQKARIEYALAGGRINTDAIDNSAGVDTSDHEVNLKILMQPAMTRGELSFEDRNRALGEAAEEVARMVIADNRDQNLMLSLEQLRSRTQAGAFRDHLTAIEQRGVLRRHEEALPTREALRDRRSRYPGLTRPELAVLSAYTKLDLTRRLEQTALIDDPYLGGRFLEPYFPPSIARRLSSEIPGHGLRRELITTEMVNELVDLMGSIFIFGLTRDYGIDTAEAVRAWLIGGDVIAVPERVERLKAAAGGMSAEAELAAFFAIERAVDRAARWAILELDPATSIGEVVGRYSAAVEELSVKFESLLAAGERDRFERTYRGLRAAVHQEALSHELARLAFADHLLQVLTLSFALGIEPADALAVHFRLNEHLDFALLEAAAEAIVTEDRWERRAAHEVAAELRATRSLLCKAILAQRKGTDVRAALARMRPGRERYFAEVERLIGELRVLPAITLPALQVACRALQRLAKSVGASP